MEYHQLTYGERYRIARMKSMGEGCRAIARKLGRCASTISRELRRNAEPRGGGYWVDKAHSYAVARRRRCRRGTQFEAQEVQLVHELMQDKWSPQQISGRLRVLGTMDIGTSTYLPLDQARQGARRGAVGTHAAVEPTLPQGLPGGGSPRKTDGQAFDRREAAAGAAAQGVWPLGG